MKLLLIKEIKFCLNLIGKFYDLWDQNYVVMGDEKKPKYFTRVALGAYTYPML
jgi:hypothetical protein